MIKFIYCIKDHATSIHTEFLAISTNEAMRMLRDTCSDPTTSLARHPRDYSVYQIGTFDTEDGTIEKVDRSLVMSDLTSLLPPPPHGDLYDEQDVLGFNAHKDQFDRIEKEIKQ